MKLVGEKFHPDLAILNIGGHFGMEVPEAIMAAGAVRARLTIPQHYKTFPVLTQDPTSFLVGVKRLHLAAMAPQPGETIKFQGRQIK
jgi:L-ascorbate metabolism protein UlaG (beta-lactamase superfamily)